MKVLPFLAVSVATVVLLARVGVDPGWLLTAMFYATPFIVAAVVSFVVFALRQNTSPTYVPDVDQPAAEVDDQTAVPTRPTAASVTVAPEESDEYVPIHEIRL